MRRKERPAGKANGQIIAITRDTGELLSPWGRYGRRPGPFKVGAQPGDRLEG